ncbi:hypothetical protein VTO42DRAFT_1349 [Malbranchea cinnamomea]
MAGTKQSELSRVSVWRRRIDMAYLGFFALHILIMLAVDLVPFYPDNLKPAVLDSLRAYYIETYQDKFFTEPPTWFWGYAAIEAIYHMPLSIWAVRALAKNHPMVPVHLLIWAVLTFITTLTCLLEAWDWSDRTEEQKWQLTMLYGPYAAFAGFMVLDMFDRLRRSLMKSKLD